MSEISTKPYLIRAIYEWSIDHGYTPYLAVNVDEKTLVPQEHVKHGEIVLNISPLATHDLQLGNDLIGFQARFGGRARDLSVPVANVTAIYAKETGQGMAFEISDSDPLVSTTPEPSYRKPSLAASDYPAPVPEKDALRQLAVKIAKPILNLAGSGNKSKDINKDTTPNDPNNPSPSGPSGKPRLIRVK